MTYHQRVEIRGSFYESWSALVIGGTTDVSSKKLKSGDEEVLLIATAASIGRQLDDVPRDGTTVAN